MEDETVIAEMFNQGQYSKLIEYFNLHPEKLHKMDTQLYLIRSYREMSNYDKALSMIISLKEQAKSEKSFEILLEVMVEELYVIYRKEQLGKAKILAEKIGDFIEKTDFEQGVDHVTSYYNYVRGNIYWMSKDPENAQIYYLRSMDYCKYEESIRCAENFNALGNVHAQLHEYDIAIEYYQKCLELSRKISNLKFIVYSLNNLSNVYRAMGEIKQGLEYGLETVQMLDQIENIESKISILNNVGIINYYLTDFAIAFVYLNQAYQLYKEYKVGKIHITETLFYLILTSHDLDNPEDIEHLMMEFDTIAKESDNNIIALRYHLLQAILLDEKDDLLSKGKALDLMEKFEEYDFEHDEIFAITSISKLCYLLIDELRINYNNDLYDKIIKLHTHLINHYDPSSNVFLQIENLRIQAWVDQINNLFSSAVDKMAQAMAIAEESDLVLLKDKLEKQHEQLKEWKHSARQELRLNLETSYENGSGLTARAYKERLYEFEILLHPIRLAIIKNLVKDGNINSSEIRKNLDVTWGTFLTHVRKLEEYDLIEYRNVFENGNQIKRLIIKEPGRKIYLDFAEFIMDSI